MESRGAYGGRRMIEKSFNKAYKVGVRGVSQTVLTRAANRLISEYSAVFGGWCVPEEIKAISEKIKNCEEATEYEYEHSYESGGTSEKIYDKVKYTNEARACAFWDRDEYGDPLFCVTWYFFAAEFYTKRVGNQTLHASTYHDIAKKAIKAKGKYRYFCTHRPPSGGVIPAGYVSYDSYGRGERYIGEVTYNQPPSDEELNNWGLVIDKEWSKIRAAYLSEDYGRRQ